MEDSTRIAGATTYRRPRRRPAHLRTKTGCLPCRKRKKKCDEHPVYCHNCSRRKIECTWSSSIRNEVSNAHSNGLAPEENEDVLSLSTSPSSIKYCDGAASQGSINGDELLSPSSSSVSQTSDQYGFDDALSLIRSPRVTPIISNGNLDSIPLFDYMRTVFVPQLVRPTTDRQFIGDFTSQSLQLALNIPFFMDALLAGSSAEFKANDVFYHKLAESYYIKALGGLRNYLAKNMDSQQMQAIALRTILLLCIYEKSRLHPSKHVHTHLRGAAVLVKSGAHHSNKDMSTCMPDTWDAARFLSLEAFIFHTATITPFQDPLYLSTTIDDAFESALRTLELLVQRGKIRCSQFRILGAPPKLFAYVRQVALLYQRFRFNGSLELQQSLELEQELAGWNKHASHTHYVVDWPSEGRVLSLPSCSQNEDTLALGPRLYILAARILLNHMMTMLPINTTDASPSSSLLSEAMTLILCIETSEDYFADYYCWPFFCLGVSIMDPQHQEALMNKIMDFWKATRNGTMRRLANMLSDAWQKSDVCH